MDWKIGPRQAAYTSQDTTTNYGALDISNVGDVTLSYNSNTYTLQQVKLHTPLEYMSQIRKDIIAELSCLFTIDGSSPRQYIRWIFPILQTQDNLKVSLGLRSWLQTNADAKPLVKSFEDILPDIFQYVHWQDCFTSSSGSTTISNSLQICYSLEPLYVRALDTNRIYSYTTSSATAADIIKRGVNAIYEPYVYDINTTPFDSGVVTSRFAIWTYTTGRAAQKQKQKKLAKCFAVNLDRDMDANGLIHVDSTGDPLDPSTVQELAGRGPSGTLAAIDLNAIEQRKASSNTTLFWVAISLFGLVGIVVVVYLIWVFLPGRELERDILQSVATLKELSRGPGIDIRSINGGPISPPVALP